MADKKKKPKSKTTTISKPVNRPTVMIPRAGFRSDGRYGKGGKLCK